MRKVLAAISILLLSIWTSAQPAHAADDTGAISGKIMTAEGEPARFAWVALTDAATGIGLGEVFTELDGTYTHPNVRPGIYKLQINYNNRYQWVPQKVTYEDGAVFTVTAGATTVVDETLLPGAVLNVKLVDARSGRPVSAACAAVHIDKKCDQAGGLFTFTGLPGGEHDVDVNAPDGLHRSVSQRVTTVLGQTTDVEIRLTPSAAITTVVRDRATGSPVQGVCVIALPRYFGDVRYEDCKYRSAADGKVVVGQLDSGTYSLLAVPGWGHGIQWVGPSGGTGSQYRAQQLRAVVGAATPASQIRLDPAGSVTGTITDADTGEPIRYGNACATILPIRTGQSGVGGASCTTPEGTFVLNGLGPYAWPIQYTATLYPKYYAWEWSGGAADRRSADPVKVTSGQAATANAALRSGGTLTGRTLNKDGTVYSGFLDLWSYNARTGDVAGPAEYGHAGAYTLRGLASQHMKIKLWAAGHGYRWHEDAATFEKADPVRVTRGRDRTLDITLPSPS